MKIISMATTAAIPLLAAAVILALYRLLKGPSAADRVVALDVMANFAIGIVAVEAVALDNPMALLGTVAFAYYLQKGCPHD